MLSLHVLGRKTEDAALLLGLVLEVQLHGELAGLLDGTLFARAG
jgi:hypothetical protein